MNSMDAAAPLAAAALTADINTVAKLPPLDANSTSFMYQFELRLNRIVEEYNRQPRSVQLAQFIYLRYMTGRITYRTVRGTLLGWDTGVGKTIAMISTAIALERRTLVILSHSLVKNFIDNIQKYHRMSRIKEPLQTIMDRFVFVSLNASNLREQVERVTGNSLDGMTVIVEEAHSLFRQIIGGGNKNGPAIYDLIMAAGDVRIIFATATPASKDPYELVPCFNMLAGKEVLPVNHEDFKTMFISGALLEPDEELPLNVVARGGSNNHTRAATQVCSPCHPASIRLRGATGAGCDNRHHPAAIGGTSLPPNVGITRPVSGYMRNRAVFQNRISGMYSYAAGDRDKFPTELPVVVSRVPMEATYQWPAYTAMRVKERAEGANKGGRRPGLDIATRQPGFGSGIRKGSSTYRKGTRSVSNVFSASSGGSSGSSGGGAGAIISPKIDAIMAVYNEFELRNAAKGAIYSQFVEHGVYAIANKLVGLGWREIVADDEASKRVRKGGDVVDQLELTTDVATPTMPTPYKKIIRPQAPSPVPPQSQDSSTSKLAPARRFILIHGGVSVEARKILQDLYNAPDNLYGRIAALFIFTATGAEGLSLYGVRHIHALEPFWAWYRIAQVFARGNRFGSHLSLPESERNLSTYIYISVPPVGATRMPDARNENVDELTTDEELLVLSVSRQLVIDDFMNAIRETCIECTHINKTATDPADRINCRICTPTNRPLHGRDIWADINGADPCTPLVRKEIAVHSIEIDGHVYKWTTEGEDAASSVYDMAIYEWSDTLKSFSRIRETSAVFPAIYKAIMAAAASAASAAAL